MPPVPMAAPIVDLAGTRSYRLAPHLWVQRERTGELTLWVLPPGGIARRFVLGLPGSVEEGEGA